MAIEFDIGESVKQLETSGMLGHNAALAVRGIEPGPSSVETAATLLLWMSFDVEPSVKPPTFTAALRSRCSNIRDALTMLPNLDLKQSRVITWAEAMELVCQLPAGDVDEARIFFSGYEVQRISQPSATL